MHNASISGHTELVISVWPREQKTGYSGSAFENNKTSWNLQSGQTGIPEKIRVPSAVLDWATRVKSILYTSVKFVESKEMSKGER